MGKSSKGTTSSTSTSNSKTEPWGPTKPYLNDLIGMLGDAGGIGLSPDQQTAYSGLKSNALAGDPWTQNKANQTDWLYNEAGADGRVAGAYDKASEGLGKYAGGDYLDPMQNPQMQAMLDLVGDNAFDQVNSAFAGAGRDITGNAYGQQAAARGVAQAQLPILFDQYNKQQGLQMDALGQLTPLAQGATDAQGLYGAQATEMGQSALDGLNYSGERLVDLDQQIKSVPYEDIALVASILFPGAGLGGTSSSTTTGTGTSKAKMSLFSDRRLKRNVKKVGALDNGLAVYSYQYIGHPRTHIGCMADDVAGRVPEAVSEMHGMKMVDYDLATQRTLAD